jgi:hypothetical protein
MRIKKAVKFKDKMATFRCTTKEFNKIKQKAWTYTEGNISEFILYASLNFVVTKGDLDMTPAK